MKLLMENWREYLNEEAVTDTTNLGMLINSSRDGKYLLLFDTEEFINSIGKNKLKPKPSDFDEWDEQDQFMFHRQNRKNDPLENKTVQKKISQSIKGIIDVEIWAEPGAPCFAAGKKIFTIKRSAARSGYGPLLYDTALLYTKSVAGGLMADRFALSKPAQNIYKQWLARGTGATGIKIKARKFDDIDDPQTKPKGDDCYIHPETGKGKADPASNYVYSTKSSATPVRVLQKKARTSIKEFINRAYSGGSPYATPEELVNTIEEMLYDGGSNLFDKLYKG